MSDAYGSFLRNLRTSRHLTQAELAEITGISQPNISAYEAGRRLPSTDTLNRIAAACGYQLVADGGSRRLRCPLPVAGWFPDDDLPAAVDDDPVADPPPPPSTDPVERGREVFAAMQLGGAMR